MALHKGGHLLLRERVDGLVQRHAVLSGPVLDQLVGAEALLALLAVHQRIAEAAQMAGGHPGLGVHQNGAVLSHIVGVLLHELLPPCLLDIVLQLHAQRAVVPGVGQTAVNLAAGEDEAAVFTQGDDFFHGFFGVFHDVFSFLIKSFLSFFPRCCCGTAAAKHTSGASIKKRPKPHRLRANSKLSVVPPEFGSLHTHRS